MILQSHHYSLRPTDQSFSPSYMNLISRIIMPKELPFKTQFVVQLVYIHGQVLALELAALAGHSAVQTGNGYTAAVLNISIISWNKVSI